MRGYFITNYDQPLLSHMTSVEGEMGAQKFRFINSVEFLLIYLGTGEDKNDMCVLQRVLQRGKSES